MFLTLRRRRSQNQKVTIKGKQTSGSFAVSHLRSTTSLFKRAHDPIISRDEVARFQSRRTPARKNNGFGIWPDDRDLLEFLWVQRQDVILITEKNDRFRSDFTHENHVIFRFDRPFQAVTVQYLIHTESELDQLFSFKRILTSGAFWAHFCTSSRTFFARCLTVVTVIFCARIDRFTWSTVRHFPTPGISKSSPALYA